MNERVLYTAPWAFTGTESTPDFGILIQDGRICASGRRQDVEKLPYNSRFDLEGFMVPGFIDCHVHLIDPGTGMERRTAELIAQGVGNAFRPLRSGVVACRDLGSAAGYALGLREAVKQGDIIGPRIIAAGKALCATGGHAAHICQECDGPSAFRREVRRQIQNGADLIKLMVSGGVNSPGPESGPCELFPDEISAAIDAAHALGRKVSVHAHGNTAIRRSVEAGADSVEHGVFLSADTMELMARKKTFLVPTLCAPYYAAIEGLRQEPDNPDHRRSREIIELHQGAIRKATEQGVPVACGTDAGCPFNPFGKAPYEMVLLVRAGLSMEQALKAATVNAAELLGIQDSLGSLEEGREASFLCLAENPLKDITAVMHVTRLFLKGKELKLDIGVN
jgi:imidazolonepropionase-like amidohydrolase